MPFATLQMTMLTQWKTEVENGKLHVILAMCQQRCQLRWLFICPITVVVLQPHVAII